MNWMERKGPFVRYSAVGCPVCNGTLIEFDIPVSDLIVTETSCEQCDYSVTNNIINIKGDEINEMS